MAKRNLSQQQTRRIQAQQQDSEGAWGLVVAHQGKLVLVEDQQQQQHRCHFRQNLGDIAVGDRVRWQQTKQEEAVVVAIEPRESVLARVSARGERKIMAANVQQMLIAIAPLPEPSRIVIDGYTVAAEILQLSPILVCNKQDLITTDFPMNQLLDDYRQLGYPVLLTSCMENTGITTLTAHLNHHSSILVGQSGVGKSSLLKQLLPEIDIAIGALGAGTAHGKHTTTSANLYHVADDGVLIDSPGIREFGLWPMTAAELAQGFKEFQPYLGQCQFRNCQHTKEPKCAIKTAVETGDICQWRWENYQAFLGKYSSKT